MNSHEEEKLRQQQDRLRELMKELSRRRFVLKSPDGLVTVRVLATGRIVGLELDPRIYRNPDSQKLASTILDTINRASSKAARSHLKSLEEITGGEHGSFQDVMDSANQLTRRLFGPA